MYISKVNGNEVKEVEIDVNREDIIKTFFIIPPCERWFNENKPKNATLEDVVDFAYSYFDHCEFDGLDDQIYDLLNEKGSVIYD